MRIDTSFSDRQLSVDKFSQKYWRGGGEKRWRRKG